MQLTLHLPPSVNQLYIQSWYSKKRIYTQEGRDYVDVYSFEVRQQLRKLKHKMFEDYFYLDLFWTLPRTNCDSHNYKKALFDMLEKAEFVSNDKYIMDRTQSIQWSSKDPHVMLRW